MFSMSLRLTANVFQAGVSFLLVQVMHLSVNKQKITLAWCMQIVFLSLSSVFLIKQFRFVWCL